MGLACRLLRPWRLPGTRPGPAGVASPIICRSALAIEAHRGAASLANTLSIGCAMRLALRSDGCAQPTTSDRCRDTSVPPSESTPKVLEGTMHGLSSARATLAAPTPGRREKRRTNAHHSLTTDPRPAQGLHTQ